MCVYVHVCSCRPIEGICRSLRTVPRIWKVRRWQCSRFTEASGLFLPFCLSSEASVILRSPPLALWDFIKYSNSIALNIKLLTHPLTVIHSLQSLGAWTVAECFHYGALGFLLSRALSTDVQPLNKDCIAISGQMCDKGVQCPGQGTSQKSWI